MQETRVQSLDLEDLLEKEIATHSSILAWKIPWMVEPGSYNPWVAKSWTRLSDFTLRDLWGSIKRSKIRIIGVQEGDEKGAENILEDI